MSNRESVLQHYLKVTDSHGHATQKKEVGCTYDSRCQGCENYEPFFKYRKCLYPICQKGLVDNVFLKKPLREDVLSINAFRAEQKLLKIRDKPQMTLGV